MSNQNKPLILLTDTNAFYKLYFFHLKDVIPFTILEIPTLGKIEFHPIVLAELNGHIKLYEVFKSGNVPYLADKFPKFFKDLFDQDFPKMLAFANENLSKVAVPDMHETKFRDKRKIYERERALIEDKLSRKNSANKRSKKNPSDEDYLLLYTAEEIGCAIITHDEKLALVAIEILDDSSVMGVEDIIANLYRLDPTLLSKIESAITNMEFIKEDINKARIFPK